MILQQILVGMSEKMWDTVIKHARECELGKRMYILRGSNFTITFNPICEIVRADIDGRIHVRQELSLIDRVRMTLIIHFLFMCSFN